MAEAIRFGGRAPDEAVSYLQDRTVGGRFSFDHRDVWRDEHLTAFVVAKATTADVLADIHGDLVKAMAEGWSQERFAAELRPKLEAKGWWGKQAVADPATGEIREVQLGSPRRLKVIFETNMRQAYLAAQWQRLWDGRAVFPLLRYRHVDAQAHPRVQHAIWGGTILPIEHPWWATHYPMNGWGCKCSVVAERRGEITPDAKLQARGDNDLVAWRNRRTGQTGASPRGIDPGFAYNVGQARRAALTPPAMEEPRRSGLVGERLPRRLPIPPAPRPLPDDVKVDPTIVATPEAMFEAMSPILGVGEGGVFIDKAQVPIVVGRRLFEAHDAAGASAGPKTGIASRAPLAEIFAATLRDPDEIWHAIQVRQDGRSMLVRNLIAWFDAPEAGRQVFVVTFHEGGPRGVWMGATAFGPGKVNRPGSQQAYADRANRIGTLVYRRK